MRYLVLGPTFVNNVHNTDGTVREGLLGGSIYCVTGILAWDSSVLYVSNVGPDFESHFGTLFDENGLSSEGLQRSLKRTQYTNLYYDDSGIHDEVSVYGPEEDEFNSARDVISAEIAANLVSPDTLGIYIEASETDVFWSERKLFPELEGVEIMWEPPTSACLDPTRRSRVKEVISEIGLYSINATEARALLSLADDSSVDEVVAGLQELGTTCFLRMGAKGSGLLTKDTWTFGQSLVPSEVVDTTGCGNASTAAALVGICQGREPKEVVAMANISAYLTLLQYGPIRNAIERQGEAFALLDTVLNNDS